MDIIFWIVVANVLAMVVMYAIQVFEAATKKIPKRSKKFLYLQDWYTTTVGDVVGISLYDAAVVPQLLAGALPFHFVAYALIFGFAFTAGCFAHFLSKRHIPDAGVPRKGQLSLNGLYHACYFFTQASIGFYGFELLATGYLQNSAQILMVLGASVYFLAFVGDTRKFLPR